MSRLRLLIVATICLVLATVALGCSSDDSAVEGSASDELSAEEHAIPESAFTYEEIDLENFSNPTNVDNRWFPLRPGTQYVYEGSSVDDEEELSHRVVFTVTNLTKVVNGIETLVVWDQDYVDGELVEAELAFFAQDDDGVVWHFGQYPEEYEDGELQDAPAWIAGVGESRAGISMKADSREGDASYSQGWSPEVTWTDRARVYQKGMENCVRFDCFKDVLVMEEFSLEEPGAFQLKYYAPETGLVRVGWRGEDESQEELELVDFTELDAAALAEARAAVLELEERAYEISPDMYGSTPRIAP